MLVSDISQLQEETKEIKKKNSITPSNSTQCEKEKSKNDEGDKNNHKLGSFHEAEEHLQDNQYILRGYRIKFNSSRKLLKR